LKDGKSLPCQVWVMPGEPKAPRWAPSLLPLVDISDLRNSTSSVAVLFDVDGRFFAVCFGYAQSMLNHNLLEPEFGLRVTANLADPLKVAAIQVRTLSENSRQQRSQTANKTRVADFDVEVEREWLRYLKADVASGIDWASGVAGSQSLAITTKMDLSEFPAMLSKLLDTFHSDAYKASFPYIDNFVPVAKGDPVLPSLNKALAEAISQPAMHKIGVACPDDLVGADVACWKVFGDGKRGREPLDDLDLSAILAEIPPNEVESSLEKLKILPLDASDSPMRTKRQLFDYFVFEFTLKGETYALCLGQWFRISVDYVQEINERIAAVEDISSFLALPPWRANPDGKYPTETTYNKDICKDNEDKYIHLDTKNFSIGGSHQKVEIADLLTKNYDFVCVKRMEDSATLSHLFSQAAVSADLYASNAVGRGKDSVGYADRVKEIYEARWGNLGTLEVDKRMVLGIATEKPGPVADSLFFFSKVNLAQRIVDLRKSGFRVSIAKIDRP
jgi:uncharacterized protein (TIGR04141 family)